MSNINVKYKYQNINIKYKYHTLFVTGDACASPVTETSNINVKYKCQI